jgi:hypothetical protein
MPNYKFARQFQAPNIYHVNQEVSDLKDEDFVKAAEEYKAKKAQELATRQAKQNQASNQERERERNVKLWVGIGCGVLGVGLVGLVV